MNMVPCDKPCIHQQNGCCTVCGTAAPAAISGECSYFSPSFLYKSRVKGGAQRIDRNQQGILRRP
jgi:hypothetical protein